VVTVGRVQGLSVGHLGSEGMVLLHGYAQEADFPRFVPVLERINDSFHYDPGYEFKPGRSGFNWGSVGGKAVIGGIVGGLIGLAGWLFRKLSGR
jgi:hypothetical protein